MNDAVPVETEGLLTTARLAARADFTLGLAVISPSARTIAGPGGAADVEPRVMQVLVVLADAAGQVVTRGTLFDRCWGGVFVGDDSLNRTIGAIRKLAAEIAGGSFEVETIPRTGYRLKGDARDVSDASLASAPATESLSRRALFGGGVAAVALLAGGGWWWREQQTDSRFKALIDKAEESLRHDDFDDQTRGMLEQAISIRPNSAKAWGLLALFKSIVRGGVDPKDTQRLVEDAEKTARHALSLDPKQPDALLAMFELQGSTLDWITRDRRLRQIAAISPDNIGAIGELGDLIAATGLVQESWTWNQRGLALEPLSAGFLGKRALKLWVFGRISEADKVGDQLWALYPTNPFAWFVRVQIYAFTGRARAALAMLDSEPGARGGSPLANLWRACLPALDDPAPGNVAKARDACMKAASASGMAANESILVMSALRDLDMAFDIADGSLLARGPFVPKAGQPAADAGWRINTQWMWAPPVAAMRADLRFLSLCRSIGLTDYWKMRGVTPDYMRARV